MLARFIIALFFCGIISPVILAGNNSSATNSVEKVEQNLEGSIRSRAFSLDLLDSETVLELTAPGTLVPSILTRLGSMEGTSEDFSFLVNVAVPILNGVHRRIDTGKFSPKILIAYQEASSLLETALKITRQSTGNLDENILAEELLSLAAASRVFIEAGHSDTLKNDWSRYGRWSELSSTLCEPWILPSLKVDVVGASKIIPFGPLPLVNEKERNNLGEMSNYLLLFSNWFHVGRSLLAVNGTKKVLKEIGGDISEMGRGPVIVLVLAANGEWALAFEASRAFLREIYEAVNRNRKIFTLHPLGTVYLYAGLNLLATPLIIFDFKGFYLDDINLRLQDLKDKEPFTVAWYSRVFILIGKAITPVFVISQFYDKAMATKSQQILSYLGDHTGVFGRAAKGAVCVALPLMQQVPMPAIVLKKAAETHKFMGVWGPQMYNAGNYITGCAGAAFLSSCVLYEFVNRFVQNTFLAVGTTAGIVGLYASAYTQAAAKMRVGSYSVREIAVKSQTFVFASIIAYDHILKPAYDWLNAPAEQGTVAKQD